MRKNRKKSRTIELFLGVVLAGYTLFFTSKLWFPDHGDLIEATPYYEKMTFDTYKIYLTEWKYSGKDREMQVIAELENSAVLDEKLEFRAVERSAGELEVLPVQEAPEYAVLRIKDLPENWKEISLRIGDAESENQAKFYTNMDAVEKTDHLKPPSKEQCRTDRLQAQIRYDDARIMEKQKEIAALEKENRSLSEKAEVLRKDTYLSEAEVKQAENMIGKAENQILLNQDYIAKKTEEITVLEDRTENIRKQMKG